MSFSSITLSPATFEGARRTTVRSLLLRTIETVELWGERRHQRRALRELPDYARHDMGLSLVDIEAEASKPFWRA